MRPVAGVAIGLCLLLSLSAAAQDILVRTALAPQGPVMLGQKVQLSVDVLFPGEMPHPPGVAAPRVEGAQVFRFETQATNLSERIGDMSYVGQRFVFDLYARRAGTLSVPPQQITLLNATDDPVGTRSTPALTLQAVAPPGLDPSAPIIASTSVTLDERWQPQSKTFHVGDALTRLVTRDAADVPGLALAALDFPAPPGIRAYVDAPVIADITERGDITGRRTDRVTYIFEQGGRFTLPGFAQPWWDLGRRSAHTLSLPALTVEVVAAPAAGKRPWLAASVWLVAGLVLVGMVFGRHGVVARWSSWRAARRDVEGAAFMTLRRACRTVDIQSTYRAWQRWSALRRNGAAMPPDLAAAVAPLQQALFGRHGEWTRTDARRLVHVAQAARTRRPGAATNSALPPLNPPG